MISVEPATPEYLKAYYGHLPSRTTRSLVVMEDGMPIAVVGVYTENGRMVLFAEISDYARQHKFYKRGIILVARRLKSYLSASMPVYSIADPRIEGSATLLEHLGFERYDGDTYICLN